MTDSIYEQVLRWLDTTDMSLREIADGSGVPLSTVKRIASRRTQDPSVRAIEKLSRYRQSVEHRVS